MCRLFVGAREWLQSAAVSTGRNFIGYANTVGKVSVWFIAFVVYMYMRSVCTGKPINMRVSKVLASNVVTRSTMLLCNYAIYITLERALMSSLISTVFRFLLLPVVMLAGFVTYGYSMDFFAQAIPIGEEKSLIYGTLLAQGFLAAAVVSALFSYPLALLYRKTAIAVAVAMSFPVLVLRLPEILNFSRHPYAIVISSYEVLAYFILLVAGVWLARNQLTRSNIAVKRDAPKATHPLS